LITVEEEMSQRIAVIKHVNPDARRRGISEPRFLGVATTAGQPAAGTPGREERQR